jgi:hypothetical protein
MGWNTRLSPVPPSSEGRETRIWSGLSLLRDAWERARALKEDPWAFAVDIRQLREAGLTNTDLRWLICKGYAEHAIEDGSAGAGRRSILKVASLTLPERTCFVLTARGLLLATRKEFGVSEPPGTPVSNRPASGSSLPRWDG